VNGETAPRLRQLNRIDLNQAEGRISLNNSHEFEGAEAEQLAADLNDGLKSCRALLNDYRTKIVGIPTADNSNEPEFADLPGPG